ncbi:exopolysaccharide biosynthesis protein, glycosyltransferase [Streptococcus pneumoniae]|nr:exopolysaccharide biosynthesis protein, glycosyltransferase [Streptococcus pneumoniae]
MKLLHFSEVGGGVDRYIKLYLKYSDKEHFKNIVVGLDQLNRQTYEQEYNIKFYHIDIYRSLSPIKLLRAIKQFRKILYLERPDIVYLHSTFAGVVGRLASMGLSCKVVYNPHGWSFKMDVSKIKQFVYKNIEKFLSYLTDKYILISKSEYEAAQSLKIPLKKLTLVYNGVEIDEDFNENQINVLLPINKYVIGMIGRISEQKNPFFFVEFAKKLSEIYSNLYFVIVGDGELRGRTEELIEEYGLRSSFFITGWVDNPEDYLAQFNQAVLFSKWEGFGLAVAEYMKHKKPILITNVDGMSELVIDGESGFKVPLYNLEVTVDRSRSIIENRELANELGSAAFQRVRSTFEIKEKVSELENIFMSLREDDNVNI